MNHALDRLQAAKTPDQMTTKPARDQNQLEPEIENNTYNHFNIHTPTNTASSTTTTTDTSNAVITTTTSTTTTTTTTTTNTTVIVVVVVVEN